MERISDDTAVVALVGGEHATDDGRLEQALASGATRLLVDLELTTEVATPELNALLRARQRLLQEGGRIALVVPRRLRRVLELMRFDTRFVLARDRLEALRLLGVVQPPGRDFSARRAA